MLSQRLTPIRPLILWSSNRLPKALDGDKVYRRLREKSMSAKIQHNNVRGEVYHSEVWRGGRSFDTEDRKACVVHHLTQMEHKRRYSCIAKALPADTQINEIDENGEVVVLSDRPKGRWIKTHPGDRTIVYEEPRNDEEHVAPPVRRLWTNFGHYLRDVGKVPLETPFVVFECYRENISLAQMSRRISVVTGAHGAEQQQHHGGTRHAEILDTTHACITHLGSLIGATKEMLPHATKRYSLHPMFLNPLWYSKEGGLPRPHPDLGARYVVLLRNVDISTCDHSTFEQQITNALQTNGFYNYFPSTTLGSGNGVSWWELGAAVLQGDYDTVLRGFIQSEAESHPVAYLGYLSYLASSEGIQSEDAIGVWLNTIGNWPECRPLRRVLEYIRAQGSVSSAEDVVKNAIPEIVLRRYVQSFQEYMWNAMVSRVVGETLINRNKVMTWKVVSDGGSSDILVTPNTSGGGISHDTVLPLYGTDFADEIKTSTDHSMFVQFLQHHSISTEQYLTSPHVRQKTTFRRVIGKAHGVSVRVVPDPNSLCALKSDLFQLQERKPDVIRSLSSLATGVADLKLRTPCAYNHSPQFMESFKRDTTAHKNNNNNSTVVLELVLSRGSYLHSALRDVFDVKYKSYHETMTFPTLV
eukprot:PhF_6_TR36171/c0_g1_i1/m.52657/K06176/truD, PUS7; tRNA pseudouridine13 synthase